MPKPKVVDPKVLDLIQKFPRMRLEGEEAPPEAHVPTQIVMIPGRETPSTSAMTVPRSLYRISVTLVKSQTGLSDGLGRASGVAQAKEEIAPLAEALVRQVLASLPPNKTVRIGVVGIRAGDALSTREKADEAALRAIVAAVAKEGASRAVVISPEATRQLLDASGRAPDAVLQDPYTVKGFRDLDYILVGSVLTFMP
jgi:hypothetical protein